MSVAEWMTEDLWRGVREFADAYHSLGEAAVADRFVRAMSAEQRRAALRDAVLEIVSRHREAADRARARAVEAAATYPVRVAEWEAEREARRADWAANPSLAPRNTKVYREWAATDEGKRIVAQREEFAAREQAEQAEADRLWDEDPMEWNRRYGSGRIAVALEEYAATIRLQVTRELLESSFALGDGRVVTWGDATIADHMTRIGLLQRQAIGTGEAIVRHEAAIGMLREAGAATLSDIATVAA